MLDASLPRCRWARPTADGRWDERLARYHDEEWGTPVEDDVELFERLALESFQAGLAWITILRKREAFRQAFAGFDPAVVGRFGASDVERLLADAGIVRNRAKVEATIANAAAVDAIRAEGTSFGTWLRLRVPDAGRTLPPVATAADVPARTLVSDHLSTALRRAGFRFVGSTIVYAFMQSVGLVDDHVPGCFRYRAGNAGPSELAPLE
ncbi:MAG TPA: DNA-3-methyladenine glycosylase I [Candidatus Limnocylindrales bacterium]|nr:DNA-3-methyladenine glycosylase I [Candidatus Limnocylindrales bacterium]